MNTDFHDRFARYLRYSDKVETIAPNEDELIGQIVDSMMRMSSLVFDKYRHALRNAHAKSHGVLVGSLTVHGNLPYRLRQGLFAKAQAYPIVARFSSAPGDIFPDALPTPKGLAIKVIDVPGRKFLRGQEQDMTQDFLFANHPILPFGTLPAFWKLQQLREKHADDPEALKRAAAALAGGAVKAINLTGIHSTRLANRSLACCHILGETFHSMAPIRYGNFVAKLSVAPSSHATRALTDVPYDPDDEPSILRQQIARFFHHSDAQYELRVQLCTDLETMPVEDASVPWPDKLSAHETVATITLPRQETFSPERRAYADEVLSFNPWHCLVEHRPLGAIMRARQRAYEASSRFRHAMNGQPRVEPSCIAEVPD